jgi:diguanylate cyclase (GGDEF)-like protein
MAKVWSTLNPTDLLAAMRRTVEQLAAFNEIAKALTSTLEVGEVLQLVMQKVQQLLKPSAWSLILQGKDGLLQFEIVVGPAADSLKGQKIRPGEGICGAVFQTGQPRLVADVSADPDFAPRFDAATSFKTRQVLAVPLIARGNSLGVIELVSDEGGDGFDQDDLQMLTQVADYAAIAIDNARNFRRVEELTLSDEHTGLGNTRAMRTLLKREVARAERFVRPVSLLFLDLDNFKSVNDTRGHIVGSALLRQVGARLLDCIRSVDSAFRYGGDEFAVVLLETGPTGGQHVAQRIVERMRTPFDMGIGEAFVVTCSVGVAAFPDHATTASGLLDAADKAMYRAKNGGRNQVQAAHAGEGRGREDADFDVDTKALAAPRANP